MEFDEKREEYAEDETEQGEKNRALLAVVDRFREKILKKQHTLIQMDEVEAVFEFVEFEDQGGADGYVGMGDADVRLCALLTEAP